MWAPVGRDRPTEARPLGPYSRAAFMVRGARKPPGTTAETGKRV